MSILREGQESVRETAVSSKDALTRGYDTGIKADTINAKAQVTGSQAVPVLENGITKLTSAKQDVATNFSSQQTALSMQLAQAGVMPGNVLPTPDKNTTQPAHPDDTSSPAPGDGTPTRPANIMPNIDKSTSKPTTIPKLSNETLDLMKNDGFSTLEGNLVGGDGKGTDFRAYIGTDGQLVGVDFNKGATTYTAEAIRQKINGTNFLAGKIGVDYKVNELITVFANLTAGKSSDGKTDTAFVGGNTGFDANWTLKSFKTNSGTTTLTANAGVQASVGTDLNSLKAKQSNATIQLEAHGSVTARYTSDAQTNGDPKLMITSTVGYSKEYVPGSKLAPNLGTLTGTSRIEYRPNERTLIDNQLDATHSQGYTSLSDTIGLVRGLNDTGSTTLQAHAGLGLTSTLGQTSKTWGADAGVYHDFGKTSVGGGVIADGSFDGKNKSRIGVFGEVIQQFSQGNLFLKGTAMNDKSYSIKAGTTINF